MTRTWLIGGVCAGDFGVILKAQLGLLEQTSVYHRWVSVADYRAPKATTPVKKLLVSESFKIL
ncbi:MAG: hypothetical protein ACYSWP_11725 [Planctomycetota bacterium]